MLHELEVNWLSLEQKLLAIIAVRAPETLTLVREWLQHIRLLPIMEKTMYMAELCEPLLVPLATIEEQEEWKQVKTTLLNANQVNDTTVFQFFDRTMDVWVHLSRQKGGK